MRLLYFSYWNSYDPLTSSTVLPHLEIAAEMANVEQIVLVTADRDARKTKVIKARKTIHIPLYLLNSPIGLFNGLFDFIRLPAQLSKIIRKFHIDLLLAKGVLAGAVADRVFVRTGIRYITESFEPHCDYMVESNEWRKNGIKYRLLRAWEKNQINHAKKLFTVSE